MTNLYDIEKRGNMKIGLMGFDFTASNKGCEALTYSFVNMLVECFGNDMEIKNFSYRDLGQFPTKYPSIKFSIRRPQIKNPLDWIKLLKEISELDIVFDVTFGDGFSDIYGKMWNATTDFLKELVIISRTPLFLLPQTYGPYKSIVFRVWAQHIIKHSFFAFSRDIASANELNELCDNKIQVLTDMAFALPYDEKKYLMERTHINIGINVSSLLWDSMYAKENKFNLKVDYKAYITGLINTLMESGKYRIHLIPHVIDQDYNAAENDVRACDAVKNIFSSNNSVICAPAFEDPIDAKSYISGMDIFMGARMHATIAAVSSGVATIPFAYSKKFKTMFENLNYKFVIEGRYEDTQSALRKTIEWINDYMRLEECAQKVNKISDEKLKVLKSYIKQFNVNDDL